MDSITFCWLKEFSSITLNRQKGEISFAQYVATKVQKKGKKKKKELLSQYSQLSENSIQRQSSNPSTEPDSGKN